MIRAIYTPPLAESVIEFARGRIALRCGPCNGQGESSSGVPCVACAGHGFIGIDGTLPASGQPGSESKLAMLMARYQSGLPLWDERDEIGIPDDEEKLLRVEAELLLQHEMIFGTEHDD